MPRLDIIRYSDSKEYQEVVHELISTYSVLGFCVFGGTTNSIKTIIAHLQNIRKENSEKRLLFSIDAEWGTAMRIADGVEYPHAFALAKTSDTVLVQEVGYSIGKELWEIGIDWNFAPVADINSNPNNPIINIRSFGDSSGDVAEYAVSFQQGLHKAGMLTSAKHFPGHGDTIVDSHQGLPYIERSYDEFLSNELLPFERLIAAKIPSIMLGHLAAPQLASEFGADEYGKMLPATISPALTTNLLRKKLCYDGVVITDSLEMSGIRALGISDSEIAIKAIQAGVDILLMPHDPIEAYRALETIADTLTDSRIESLFEERIPTNIPVMKDLPTVAARRAVKIHGILDTSGADYFVIHKDNEQDKKKAYILKESLSIGTEQPSDSTIIIIIDRPRGQLTEEKVGIGIKAQINEVLAYYRQKNISPRGIILLGNPYLQESFASVTPQCIIHAYSDSLPSLFAVMELLK